MPASDDAATKRQRRPGGAGLWVAALFVAVLVLAGAAAAAFYALKPVTLRIAVGPNGSDDLKLVQNLAQYFARERSSVRLLPVPTDGAAESIAELTANNADLAVARGDLEMPTDAQSVAILRKNVAVLWAPAAAPKGVKKAPAPVKSVDELVGRKIGVIGRSQANVTLLRVILTEEGVAADRVNIVQFSVQQIAEMARDMTLDAFMAVGPLDSRITGEAIAATVRSRGEPKFIPIEVSEAIAQKHPLYESEEIPGSTFATSPARPEDKIETVAVNHLIIAPKALSEITVTEFTRQLFSARQALARENPGVAKIEAPDTDKDAALPAHRGAAAFIDGTERTFLERYSDYLWGAVLLLSGVGSAGAWFRNYLRRDEKHKGARLRERALALIADARRSQSLEELERMQREVDALLRDTLECFDDGAIEEGDLSAFGLVLEQFHHAVADRRIVLTHPTIEMAPSAAVMSGE